MAHLTLHSPQGTPPRTASRQFAPRPDGLAGRTVYLIDVNFNDADRLLRHVGRWLVAHVPGVTVKTAVLDKGYYRPYPDVYRQVQADGHAAIIAIGHCSGCAPWVTRHAVALEADHGVPAVPMHVDAFARVVTNVAAERGLPGLPMAFFPTPVMGRDDSAMADLVAGADAVTGRPLMAQVVEALTRAPAAATAVDRPAAPPRLVTARDADDAQRLFADRGWTDFLPIVPPTPERVDAMLAGTCCPRDEVIGRLAPNNAREPWAFTAEQVAVNAVMAGARPAYLPVILALATSGLGARMSTTTSAASMCVVNGPVRHEIGMNPGIGALGPYNHANATIGRAWGLLSQNLQGGSVPGDTFMGSQGNGYAYGSLTFPENEEHSPWEPLHVQRGFRADQSTVSVFHGNRVTLFSLGLRERHWAEHVRTMLRAVEPGKESPTLVLDPIAARQFVDRGGFARKADLIDWVYDHATMPAGVFWDYQTVYNYVRPAALRGEQPYAAALDARPDEFVRMFRRDRINVVVVGGQTNGYWRIFGNTLVATAPVDGWRAGREFTPAACDADGACAIG